MELISVDSVNKNHIKYKCEYDIEKKDIKEYAMSQGVFVSSLIIVALLLIGIDITVWFATKSVIATVIITLILFVGYVFLPSKFIKILYNDFVSRNKNANHIVMQFSDKMYDICEAGAAVYEYESINNISQTKNLFVLKMKNNAVMLLRKDSFSKGNSEKFAQFINDLI